MTESQLIAELWELQRDKWRVRFGPKNEVSVIKMPDCPMYHVFVNGADIYMTDDSHKLFGRLIEELDDILGIKVTP